VLGCRQIEKRAPLEGKNAMRRDPFALENRSPGRVVVSPLALMAVFWGLALPVGCNSGPGTAEKPSWKNPFSAVAGWAKGKHAAGPAHGTAQKPKRDSREYHDEMGRAVLLEKSRKYDQARVIYEGLTQSNPERYEAFHRLGVVADREKRLREAERMYSQAVRLEKNDPELFNDYGYCLFLQGKLDHAELTLLKAVGLEPRNQRFRNNLGMVYGHQRRYQEAMEQFRIAGTDADAFYNLAFVLAAQDQIDKAKNCFHMSLRADPSYKKAQQALQSFEEFEADPEGRFDSAPLADNGLPWVPYVEGSESGEAEPNAVQQASHVAPANGRQMVSPPLQGHPIGLYQGRNGTEQPADTVPGAPVWRQGPSQANASLGRLPSPWQR
jgi:Tfp pilus assembly protein PilF